MEASSFYECLSWILAYGFGGSSSSFELSSNPGPPWAEILSRCILQERSRRELLCRAGNTTFIGTLVAQGSAGKVVVAEAQSVLLCPENPLGFGLEPATVGCWYDWTSGSCGNAHCNSATGVVAEIYLGTAGLFFALGNIKPSQPSINGNARTAR